MDTHSFGFEAAGLSKGSRLEIHHDTEGGSAYALWYSDRRSIDPHYHVAYCDAYDRPWWVALPAEGGDAVGEGPSIPEAILNALRNEAME